MWVRSVRLADFRSYAELCLQLTTGVTTFVGANGQGKTNLVEAIGYASVLGSHRVANDAPLVRIGAERAIIGVEVVTGGRVNLVELELNPGRANRAQLNKSRVSRPRDLVGTVRTVLFAPEDLALVKGEPTDRRRFLDEILVQRSPRLHGLRADYERILKQRNALLRSVQQSGRFGGSDVESTLDVWDEQLTESAAVLIAARVDLVGALRPHVREAYALVAGGADAVSSADADLTYSSSAGDGSPVSADPQEWRDRIRARLGERRREEFARGVTLVGPHRDDLVLTLSGSPARGFASHGESWSIALALRLAALEIHRGDGDDPILILDDVFAELDAARRVRLAERVATGTQVLITAAVPEDIPAELAGRRMRVTTGHVDEQ